MFEKESKEYAHEHCCDSCKNLQARYRKVYQDGAEFGYNKAKGELEEKYKETICNLEMNLNSITERLEELNKANEWHYLSKGEYPKECKNVLCYCKIFDVKFYSIGYTIIGGDNQIKWWSNNRSEILNVYAWKEITPPKVNE